jgi:uncharacterized membrane protein
VKRSQKLLVMVDLFLAGSFASGTVFLLLVGGALSDITIGIGLSTFFLIMAFLRLKHLPKTAPNTASKAAEVQVNPIVEAPSPAKHCPPHAWAYDKTGRMRCERCWKRLR